MPSKHCHGPKNSLDNRGSKVLWHETRPWLLTSESVEDYRHTIYTLQQALFRNPIVLCRDKARAAAK